MKALTKQQAKQLAREMIEIRRCYHFPAGYHSGKAVLCGWEVGILNADNTIDCGNDNSLSYNEARRRQAELVAYWTDRIYNGEDTEEMGGEP